MDDFKSCNCGGNLNYVPNLNPSEGIKSNTSNDVKFCPVCNGKNSETSQICAICGKKLDNIPYSRKATSNPNAQNLKPFAARYRELLNLKALAAGCIVFAAAFVTQGILIGDTKTFYASDNIMILEVLLGGVATGYVADPEYRTGLSNGVLYGLIVRILLLTFIIVVVGVFPYMSPYFTVGTIIFGSLGALIGTTFQKLIITVK